MISSFRDFIVYLNRVKRRNYPRLRFFDPSRALILRFFVLIVFELCFVIFLLLFFYVCLRFVKGADYYILGKNWTPDSIKTAFRINELKYIFFDRNLYLPSDSLSSFTDEELDYLMDRYQLNQLFLEDEYDEFEGIWGDKYFRSLINPEYRDFSFNFYEPTTGIDYVLHFDEDSYHPVIAESEPRETASDEVAFWLGYFIYEVLEPFLFSKELFFDNVEMTLDESYNDPYFGKVVGKVPGKGGYGIIEMLEQKRVLSNRLVKFFHWYDHLNDYLKNDQPKVAKKLNHYDYDANEYNLFNYYYNYYRKLKLKPDRRLASLNIGRLKDNVPESYDFYRFELWRIGSLFLDNFYNYDSGTSPLPVKFHMFSEKNVVKNDEEYYPNILSDDFISFRRSTLEQMLIRHRAGLDWRARFAESHFSDFNITRGFVFYANFYNEELSEDYIDFFLNYQDKLERREDIFFGVVPDYMKDL